MLRSMLIALVALALPACSLSDLRPVTAGAAEVVAKADTVVLTGARAFAVAELGYITAAKGVEIAANNGIVTGTLATRVRGWNVEARQILVKGKATADTAMKARLAARLFEITAGLDAAAKGN